ncbi:flagellin, partial [Clostridium sp. AM49-4BH]|uniref:flagellin n=1 Tax=Clostridium sp. AM49-4BH TaxID=2293035 RepID=UPI000E517C65
QSDRQAIQDEISQLTTEIDRVAETTKFNETYLLKGDKGTKDITLEAHDAGLKGSLTNNGNGTATFVMDALEAGDSVSIGGKTYTIGSTKAEVEAEYDKQVTAAGNKVTINGKEITIVDDYTTPGNADAVAAEKASGKYKLDDAKALIAEGSTVTFANGKTMKAMKGAADGVDDEDNTIITADHAYGLAKDELLAANKIGVTKDTPAVAVAATDNTFTITLGKAEVANTLSFSLHVGSDADMTNKIQVNIETMNSDYLGVKNLNVADDSGKAATYAIDAIADAVSKVSSQRSALGAVQNRLEHTIDNLDNVVENTTSAESRIRDTDMAEEMVAYSKNNILQQAGQSMLAQANQANQGVLSLLQ